MGIICTHDRDVGCAFDHATVRCTDPLHHPLTLPLDFPVSFPVTFPLYVILTKVRIQSPERHARRSDTSPAHRRFPHSRAAVELAKDWRTDKYLRNLEAMMIVADRDVTLILTGNGDVLEPNDGIAAIGSGGNYALSAARALMEYEKDAEKMARKAMAVAADICVYTNDQLTVEVMESAA